MRATRQSPAPAPALDHEAPPVAPGWRRRATDLGRDLARRWSDDRVTGLAAEVAFFGLLSVFPALIAVAAAVGFLEQLVGGELATRAQEEVLSPLRTFLTEEASESIDAVEALFRESSRNLLTLALAGALWSASRGTAAVMRALDVISGVEERRSWLRQRLVALGLMVATVVAMALTLSMLVLGPLLGGGHSVASALGLGDAFAWLWRWLRGPVTFAILVAWAAAVLHLAPARCAGWRSELPGALATGVLWLGVSAGLRLYLAVAGATNPVFGILGGVLIVVVWIYLLSLALLLGGELNAALTRRPLRRAPA